MEEKIQEMLNWAMDNWDENLLTHTNLKDIVKVVYESGYQEGYHIGNNVN